MELRYALSTSVKSLMSFNSVHHITSSRCLSSTSSLTLKEGTNQASKQSFPSSSSKKSSNEQTPGSKKTKTVAQADAELRERLERMSGDGGAAGIEYEDGKPSAMKRGVRNNMFRLI